MAEFTELDGMLRDALQRAAQPGDSTGVADAIRSRVAAGDPGTSVAASTAPGWGGGVSGWLPWLGLIVLAGIGGTALGASGVIAGEPREILAGYTAVLDDSAPAASCPGGPVIDELFAGDRVLAIARSEDSGYLGVRDPNDFARTLWFDRAVVVVDAGQADVDGLPIEACPVATVEVIEPTPVPTEEPEPQPEPEPEPEPVPGPSDTTPPSILQEGANPTKIYGDEGNCGATTPLTSTVAAYVVSDNVAVTGVRATWTAAGGGSAELTRNASVWSFVYDPPSNFNGGVNITLVARDAAGNLSAPKVVNVQVSDSCFG
jgi:hypothetical protein